jgi:uncharacterized protein YndB with AHSA1/START domain
MEKFKIKLEYPLKNASINVLWNCIGTPLGLAEWFADEVNVHENQYTFRWKEHEQSASLLELKTNSHIRFQWEEDLDSDYFFELQIVALQVTGDLALVITDFAEKGEEDDLKLLWGHQIEQLRRKTGI